jgi:PAS domain S-box-containing protein
MPQESIHHFRATFFQQVNLPMAVLDRQGHLLDCNDAAARTLKFNRDEALGQSALVFRGPEDDRRLELLLKRTLRTGRSAEFETWVTRADGSDIPVAMNVCPLADAKGCVNAVGIVLRDRSRQKALERRLADHEQMVALGRLAGGMSHYINNILAAVSARVELALGTGDADATQQALRLTAESIDRLGTITRNLLLYSAVETRPTTTCQPAVVARRVVQHARDETRGSAVAIASRITDTADVALDAGDFQQVLVNLLNNARDAVAAGGTVTVTLSTDRGEVALRVRDTGKGIRAEDLPHVFDPFWTTRGSLAGGAGSALGLGLTVARSLVTAAGGRIELASTPGRGTTVTVHLPPAAAPAPPDVTA